MSTIEIIVDDLPVPVDEADYKANPEKVIDEVRANRKAVREGPTGAVAQALFASAGELDG